MAETEYLSITAGAQEISAVNARVPQQCTFYVPLVLKSEPETDRDGCLVDRPSQIVQVSAAIAPKFLIYGNGGFDRAFPQVVHHDAHDVKVGPERVGRVFSDHDPKLWRYFFHDPQVTRQRLD